MNRLKLKDTIIYFGPTPTPQDLQSIDNLYAVWNLLEGFPHKLEMERELVPLVINSAIPDYSAPKDLDKFNKDFEDICNLIDNNKVIYIHCYAGHGRTGTALALLIIKYMNISADDAMAITTRLCNGPEVDEQINFVKGMESVLRGRDI